MRRAKPTAVSADRDQWTKQATAACIAAAKELVGVNGPIRPGAPVGKLGDYEWGWIVSTVVWSWIATRAEQAATEGWDEERVIRTTGLEPDPWLTGAIVSILPRLFEACPDLDWSKPVGDWSKDAIAEFLASAVRLSLRAIAARDAVEERIAGKVGADVVAREMNAATGNPLMTAAELKELEGCPF
jgi:hypothetical protein